MIHFFSALLQLFQLLVWLVWTRIYTMFYNEYGERYAFKLAYRDYCRLPTQRRLFYFFFAKYYLTVCSFSWCIAIQNKERNMPHAESIFVLFYLLPILDYIYFWAHNYNELYFVSDCRLFKIWKRKRRLWAQSSIAFITKKVVNGQMNWES